MAISDKKGKRRPFDPLADKTKFFGESLQTTDITDRELQEHILKQLKLISLKLDCLQPDDQELDVNDLDDLEEDA